MSNTVPRYKGHVITREWDKLPCCAALCAFGINSSFQCRTYPPVQRICEVFSQRVDRFLRMAGFSEQYLDLACQQILNATERLLTPWIATLPALMQQDLLLQARRQLWSRPAGGAATSMMLPIAS